jgi:hypothetical protein
MACFSSELPILTTTKCSLGNNPQRDSSALRKIGELPPTRAWNHRRPGARFFSSHCKPTRCDELILGGMAGAKAVVWFYYRKTGIGLTVAKEDARRPFLVQIIVGRKKLTK